MPAEVEAATRGAIDHANATPGGAWHDLIDHSHPALADYLGALHTLQCLRPTGSALPGAQDLQRLMPAAAFNQAGLPLRFVPSQTIPGVDYEDHIYRRGEISTRENNWHDLCNALVWSRWPRLKGAMNALHYRELQDGGGVAKQSGRGPLRDALTLFDECGMVVRSPHLGLLQALARRDWQCAFVQHRALWRQTRVWVCGHALLEKFLQPYKSMTAHAMLWHQDAVAFGQPGIQDASDALLATALLQQRLFRSPAGLSPLPLMGLPGWWPAGTQNEVFYNDPQVFRAPRDDLKAAPIYSSLG